MSEAAATSRGRGGAIWALTGVGVVIVVAAIVLFGTSGPPPASADYQEFYDFGLAHCHPGLWGDALASLKWAAKMDPRQTMAHYHLARVHFNLGDPERALAALNVVLEEPEHRRLAEQSPTYHLLWASRGHCHSANGNYEESESDFKRALELDPDNGEYWYFLCWTQLELSKLEDALASGNKALELGHKNHKSLFKVGMVHKKMGNHDTAVRYFQEALRYHRGYTAAYKNLAQSLIKLGRREEGKEHHEIARLLAEVDDEYLKFKQRMSLDENMTEEEFLQRSDDFVRFCFHYWKFPELEEWMEQLLVRDPEDPLRQYRMGYARVQLKKHRQAEEHFRHAIQLLDQKAARGLVLGESLSERERVLYRDTINTLALLLATSEDPTVRKPAEALLWARRAREMGYPGADVEAAALQALGEAEKAIEKIDEQLEGEGGPRDVLEAQRAEFLKVLQGKKLKAPPPAEKP